MSKALHKHSAIYLLGRVGPAAINLLATAVFTRLADPKDYAILVLSTSAAQVGSAALFQWLRMSLLRFAPSVSREDLVRTISTLYAAQAGLISLVFFASLPLIAPEASERWIYITCLLMLFAQAWFDLNQELQRSSLQPIRYGITFAIRSLIGLAAGSAVLLITKNGYALAATVAFSLAIAPLPFVKGHFFGMKAKTDLQLAKKIMAYGLPLAGSMFLTSIGSLGDRFIIAAILGAAATGLYGPSVDLSRQTIFVIIQAINLAGYPLVIRALEREGVESARNQLRHNADLLLWIALPLAAGFALLHSEIANLMLGPKYRVSSSELIPYVSLSAFLMCIRNFYFDQAIQLGKGTARQIIVAIIVCGSSVASNFLFIPHHGLRGAAIASIVAQAAALVASIFVGMKAFPMPFPVRAIARSALSTVIMVIAVYLAQSAWAGHGPLRTISLATFGATLYLVLSVATNAAGSQKPALRILRAGSQRINTLIGKP